MTMPAAPAATVLRGRRVQLRPVELADFDGWREVRRRFSGGFRGRLSRLARGWRERHHRQNTDRNPESMAHLTPPISLLGCLLAETSEQKLFSERDTFKF